MYPKIVTLPKKILTGKFLRMSYIENRTKELWQSFMPLKNKIKNTVGTELYSIQVYDEIFDFKSYDPVTKFTKWAAIEISGNEPIDQKFQILELEGGLYAVFLHQGSSSEFQKTFQRIFSEWLPTSNYVLDNRPHFEVLTEKYKNNHPDSEEEIWIPIKTKSCR